MKIARLLGVSFRNMAGKIESGRTPFLIVSAERGIPTQRRLGSIGPKGSASTQRLYCRTARGNRVELMIGANHSGGELVHPFEAWESDGIP